LRSEELRDDERRRERASIGHVPPAPDAMRLECRAFIDRAVAGVEQHRHKAQLALCRQLDAERRRELRWGNGKAALDRDPAIIDQEQLFDGGRWDRDL